MTVINNSLKPAILGAGIKTLHYDDTSLNSHLDEILSYTNASNGGTLLFIGFKLAAQLTGDRIKAQNSNSFINITTESVPLLSDETFITFRPTAVEPDNGTVKSVKFISTDPGNVGVINLVLDKSGGVYKAILSGMSSKIETDGFTKTINQYFFDNIDIINQSITHLVIEYQTSN